MQTSCRQNSSSSKYIIRNPLFEPFKKLMITTIKIREANTVFQETRLFSTLSITGKTEAGIFFTNIYTDFEKYKSYLTLMDFKIGFFYNAQRRIWGSLIFQQISLQITKGVAHKHFFDKDANPSTDFSYPKNRMILNWNQKRKKIGWPKTQVRNDSRCKSQKTEKGG